MHGSQPLHNQLDLHNAATTGNVGLVKFALDHGAAIDSVMNGFLPLQLACASDSNLAAVQYLIDRGAQVDAQRWTTGRRPHEDATGSTALHVACANGCIRIVDLLLRNGACIDLKDKYGSTPADVAAAKHHVDILRLLGTAAHRHRPAAGRLDKPLPIPIRSTTPPDLTHTASSSNRSSSGCSDDLLLDWYAVGIVPNKLQHEEHYLQSLERRLSGSFDSGFLRASCLVADLPPPPPPAQASKDRLSTPTPVPAAAPSPSSPPPPPIPPKTTSPSAALALSLESLDRVSRNLLETPKKSPPGGGTAKGNTLSIHARWVRSWKKLSTRWS